MHEAACFSCLTVLVGSVFNRFDFRYCDGGATTP